MKSLAAVLGLASIMLAGLPAAADDAPSDEQETLFATLDADGNERLSESEIPEAQAKYFQRLVRVGDEDGDGELTREEFLSATQEPETPVAGAEPAGRGRDAQRGRGQMQFIPIDQLFDRFDANNDDRLALEEIPEEMRPRLESLFRQSSENEITREQLVEMRDRYFGSSRVVGLLQRLDENGNGDGKLTLSEVPEPFRRQLQPMFERFGGEELDVQQVAAAMQQEPDRGRPAAESTSPEPRNRRPEQGRPGGPMRGPALLRVLDSDGDGRISRDELAAASEKFDDLDRNGDGQIDAPELFGFPRDGARPDMQRPDARRPGQRPDRPEGATDRRRRPESENDSRPARPAAGEPDADARPEATAAGRSLMSRFDTDGDEALSENEAPGFLKSRFQQIDSDGDGLISAAELRAIRGASRTGGNRPERP